MAPWPTALRILGRSKFSTHSCRCYHDSYHSVTATPGNGKANTEYQRELYQYTSGRWLYNERLRLSERRLKFDVEELKKVAAQAVNRSRADIVNFRKLAEGGFNRVFEIFMNDGFSIIARLPYPSTSPRRLATASEVATLDFARTHGIPTPRVLGYSLDPGPVGSEYILMEKLPGRPIGETWFQLAEQQRLQVLHDVVKLEAKLFNTALPASGSIYYTHDLPPDSPRIEIPGSGGELCVGPYASLRWWFGKREQLDVDRGPHDKSLPVLQAPAEKELAWIRSYARLRFPFDRQYRETFDYEKQDPEKHKQALEDYSKIAPYLPPANPELNVPILRHPDLQPNNIFVADDCTITGLIDWQHSTVLPTFLAGGIPKYFQNYADQESLSFTPPKLPEHFETMDEDDRVEALELYRRRHVHFFYLGFTRRSNRLHWQALQQDKALLKRSVYEHAGNPWEGLSTHLQLDIALVSQNWSKIAQVGPDGTIPPCPVAISEEETRRRLALDESLREVDVEMQRIRDVLGVGVDGWTSNELFEDAKEKAAMIKEEGLAGIEDEPWLRDMSEKHWPFDDFDEDE
ncbi:kinase-like domain-containing protein [Massariosphaeria phaeospora]|uniref:Kinase-like domain-containing protein n=1 Tax=Massariosphaeria phaeospora TaxID=100035 RepID=A0A7C8HZH4_9PLEO|nr:kinase-like domain-containing protein [Massariosphaeria phaeospora]